MTNIIQNRHGGKGGTRINFHIIFDNDLDVDEIETFIRSLELSDNTKIGARYSDSQFLLNQVSVDFNRVHDALHQNPTLRDKHLIWIPYDEYGGIDAINPESDAMFKQGLIKKADILGSSNKRQSDFFLWKDDRFKEEDFRGWFERRKPCIKGSDSHSLKEKIGNLKDQNSQPTNKYCWIKADPTFLGLKQIVHEPEKRVFIGERPPKLAHFDQRKSNYLSRIQINRSDGQSSSGDWFDIDLELNHDMVAVIGNKGSGKSALLDIIALAGNTQNADHFSFLNKKKFREKGGKLASQYEVKATWADGTPSRFSLNDDPDSSQAERVRYLPQSYLEKICTETTPGIKSQFQQEIKNVIFSHISQHDRLEKTSLDDLIDYHVEEIRDRISHLKSEIRKVNFDIAKLENQTRPEALEKLKAQLEEKKSQLKAYDSEKPKEIKKPTDASEDPELVKTRTEIEQKTVTIDGLKTKIQTERNRQSDLTKKRAKAQKISEKLKGLEERIGTVKREIGEDLKLLSLSVDKVITHNIDHTLVTQKIDTLKTELEKIEDSLDAGKPASLVSQQTKLEEEVAALRKKLDEPTRQYQSYLKVLEAWEKRHSEIVGDDKTVGTLKFYEQQIKDFGELPKKITKLEETRSELCGKIHAELLNTKTIYEQLFSPLSALIKKHPIIEKQMKLSFETAIHASQLKNELFEYIRQDVVGSFQGREEGMTYLESLLDETNFDDTESVVALVAKLTESLAKDQRTNPASPQEIEKQLRKGKTREAVYDFLWSLEYLNPEFALRMDGKDLSQLSPGERGLLLLVFFLLLDKGEVPIIIDQPEENLDNQTVYCLLSPAVQDVKQRRQVIMVTHSPNIAVVCDADQIVFCEIDRANGNKVSYESGSIESYSLNKAALDVLEGTLPSFENRREKYFAS